MNQSPYRLQGHEISACPHCQQRHRYALQIAVQEGVLLFAGTRATTVQLICPRTNEPFAAEIVVGTNEEFVRIADPFAAQGAPVEQRLPDVTAAHDAVPDPEFAEWARSSRQTAVEYCRGMMTAASAAIPVHFAVVQYLGIDHSTHLLLRLAAIPAGVFLLSAAAFAVAHRPRLVSVAAGEFGQVRARSLRRLNRLMTAGSALFLTATAGSLAVFAALL